MKNLSVETAGEWDGIVKSAFMREHIKPLIELLVLECIPFRLSFERLGQILYVVTISSDDPVFGEDFETNKTTVAQWIENQEMFVAL